MESTIVLILEPSKKITDGYGEDSHPGYFYRKQGVDDNRGLFCVTKFDVIPKQFLDNGDYIRCDAGYPGPRSFHYWDGTECSCGLSTPPDPSTGHHIVHLDNVRASLPVIDAYPYGAIIYIELHPEELEDQLILEPHHTRTLQELLRYLIEWDWAYTELNSIEEIAVISNGIVNTLNIPSSIKDWVIANVPEEKLGRFLKGETNARERTTKQIPDLTEELDEWLYSKISKCRTYQEFGE